MSTATRPTPKGMPRREAETEYNRPVRELFSWESLSRPPVVLEKEAYTTIVSVCLLLSIVVAFFQEWFLILLIWGGLFFIVALSKTPPDMVAHKVTTQGIISGGHDYIWSQLGPFWFTDKGTQKMLHVVGGGSIFGTLLILVPPSVPWEKIRDSLAKYLPFVEVPEKTRADKISDWLASKLSLVPKS